VSRARIRAHAARRRSAGLLLAAGLLACDPGTTRPALVPTPETFSNEMRAAPQRAAESLARALAAEGIPLARIESRDAWMDSGWFDARTGTAVRDGIVGPDIVRVRAWSDPGRPRYAGLFITVHQRLRWDPSVPAGDLESPAPKEHPVAQKAEAVLLSLGERKGIKEVPADSVASRP
jgi:hypothetical protein